MVHPRFDSWDCTIVAQRIMGSSYIMSKNNNNTPTTLPAFNDVIKIEVDVDDIYKKLMETFPEDYKHREMLAHAIIGSAHTNGGLSYIYNSLNGYTNQIDFKLNDVVTCIEDYRVEFIDSDQFVASDKSKNLSKKLPIGKCRVKSINLYNLDKLTVSFMSVNQYTYQLEETYATVNHRSCTKIPM